MEPLLVRVAEAAELASISRAKAYELIASGEWPVIRIGRTMRVPVHRLARWIDDQLDESLPSRLDGSRSRDV